MIALFSKKKTSCGGFTLAELMISIAISGILIAGAGLFVGEAYSKIISSKDRVELGSQASEFARRLWSLGDTYPNGNIVIKGSPGFDAFLFTGSSSENGALLGVADISNPDANGWFRVMEPEGFGTYGKGAPFIQELTKEQTFLILSASWNVRSVPIRPDLTFERLPVRDFSVTTYNSGAVRELSVVFHSPYYETLKGKNVFESNPEDVARFILHY